MSFFNKHCKAESIKLPENRPKRVRNTFFKDFNDIFGYDSGNGPGNIDNKLSSSA